MNMSMNEKVISKIDLKIAAIIYIFIVGLLSYSATIAWQASSHTTYVSTANDSVLTPELFQV